MRSFLIATCLSLAFFPGHARAQMSGSFGGSTAPSPTQVWLAQLTVTSNCFTQTYYSAVHFIGLGSGQPFQLSQIGSVTSAYPGINIETADSISFFGSNQFQEVALNNPANVRNGTFSGNIATQPSGVNTVTITTTGVTSSGRTCINTYTGSVIAIPTGL